LVDRIGVAAPFLVARDHADGVVEAEAIRRGLMGLSPEDREALMLTEWEGLSVRDAAAAIGCSSGTLHVRLHRARRRLAKRLEAAGAA
jgi:RNA polymerase sigma-70 factor (ECF subfamily)